MVVEVRVRGARRSSAQLKQLAVTVSRKIPQKVVRDSYRYAYERAPKRTGATREAIAIDTTRKRGAAIYINTPDNPDGRKRPYHLWMHGVGKYNIMEFIRTGSPVFMYDTADYMIMRLKKDIKKATKDL